MANLSLFHTPHAKLAMTSHCIHSGARSAALCTQYVFMASFARVVPKRVNFAMRSDWLHANSDLTHALHLAVVEALYGEE